MGYYGERGILVGMLVRVDQHFIDLRRKTLQYPLNHRFAAQRPQALVHAAHTPSQSAGEDDARDPKIPVHRENRSVPV